MSDASKPKRSAFDELNIRDRMEKTHDDVFNPFRHTTNDAAMLREAKIANYLKAVELLSMPKSTPLLVPKDVWVDLQDYVKSCSPLKRPDTREGFACSSLLSRQACTSGARGLVNAQDGGSQ